MQNLRKQNLTALKKSKQRFVTQTIISHDVKIPSINLINQNSIAESNS